MINYSTNHDDTPDYIPSFIHECYANWEKLKDFYDELKSLEKKNKYLYRNTTEHDLDYEKRLKLAVFEGRLNDTINTYASLLSQWEFTEDTDQEVLARENNLLVEGDRLTIKSFLQLANVDVLLYGVALIFISPQPLSLSLISPFDIRVPRIETINGESVLTRLGIKRNITVPDGKFKEKQVSQWWVYDSGYLTVYQRDDRDNYYIIDGYPMPITDASGSIVQKVPCVWYSSTPQKLMDFPVPPFLYLGDLSCKHFNKVSELDNIETKCNSPTWARDYPNSVPENIEPLLVGANNVIINGNGTKTYLIEPSGTAIASTHQRIKDLEERIDRASYAFLNGGEAEKTATQSIIEASQSKASLMGVANQLELATRQVFSWMVRFSNPLWREGEDYGGIKPCINISSAPSANDINAVFNGYTSGAYSRKYLLLKLKEMGWQPEGIDLEDELELISENGNMENITEDDSLEEVESEEESDSIEIDEEEL